MIDLDAAPQSQGVQLQPEERDDAPAGRQRIKRPRTAERCRHVPDQKGRVATTTSTLNNRPACGHFAGDGRPTQWKHSIPPRHVGVFEQPLDHEWRNDCGKPGRTSRQSEQAPSIARLPTECEADRCGQDAERRKCQNLSVYKEAE